LQLDEKQVAAASETNYDELNSVNCNVEVYFVKGHLAIKTFYHFGKGKHISYSILLTVFGFTVIQKTLWIVIICHNY
jgi:hypothetical protein